MCRNDQLTRYRAAQASLQKCVVGTGCSIGSKSKLNSCVLMDNVTVGDNCILQNTVICRGVTVGNHCNINDCQVAEGAAVRDGGAMNLAPAFPAPCTALTPSSAGAVRRGAQEGHYRAGQPRRGHVSLVGDAMLLALCRLSSLLPKERKANKVQDAVS